MRIYDGTSYRDGTPEEIEELKKIQEEHTKIEKNRNLTAEEVLHIFVSDSVNTLDIDDNTSLRMVSYYPSWEDLCAKSFKAEKAGFKFRYQDKLYKTIPPEHTFQSNWVPGQGTGSIYTQVVESHAGTKEDPIPVPSTVPPDSFTYVTGKYYDEDGTLWLCKFKGEDDGVEHAFVYKPSQVPTHFEKVDK